MWKVHVRVLEILEIERPDCLFRLSLPKLSGAISEVVGSEQERIRELVERMKVE
jgi:hypothetical protein